MSMFKKNNNQKKESENNMIFNSENKKKISYNDQLWLEENTPLFKSSELERSDIESDNPKDTLFTNGGEKPVSKRFIKEFKKWIDRYERIFRNILWECDDNKNFDDKLRLIVCVLFSFYSYKNKISLNSIIKCAEYVAENYLDKIDSRLLFSNLFSAIDYKDPTTIKKLKHNFEKIGDLKKVEDLTYYLKREYDIVSRMEYSDNREKEQEIALQDLNRIKEKDFVVCYRGFLVPNDTDIRLSRSLSDNWKCPISNITKEDAKWINLQGRGYSYTFDKRVAYSFAILTNSNLRHIFHTDETKTRAVVGQFIIPTKYIFAYTNRRSEREIITSAESYLKKYEFISNNKLEPEPYQTTSLPFQHSLSNYDKTSKSAIHNLYSHLKIHKIFNNTERLENLINNCQKEVSYA